MLSDSGIHTYIATSSIVDTGEASGSRCMHSTMTSHNYKQFSGTVLISIIVSFSCDCTKV